MLPLLGRRMEKRGLCDTDSCDIIFDMYSRVRQLLRVSNTFRKHCMKEWEEKNGKTKSPTENEDSILKDRWKVTM